MLMADFSPLSFACLVSRDDFHDHDVVDDEPVHDVGIVDNVDDSGLAGSCCRW